MSEFSLKFTKFFNVNSPIGIDQNEKEKDCEYHSVGVDLYFPKPTRGFLNAILKRNPFLVPVHVLYNYDSSRGASDDDIISSLTLVKTGGNTVLEFNSEKNTYEIFENITIPTGVAVLIPKGYHINNRSKSGNFNNGYTSIEGLIDENYTYDMGVQIHPFNKLIAFQVDEKFCQLELLKSNHIKSFEEVKLTDWENHPEVISRRVNRKGGFGHTGKFDKQISQ